MKKGELLDLVNSAVTTDRMIAELDEVLKKMKKDIIAEARLHPEDQLRIEDGGKSIAFEGRDGCIARVTFPKPTLKGSIDAEGAAIDKLRIVAAPYFATLFLQAPGYKPVPDLRAFAERLLGKEAAAKLVKLCTSKSSPRVSFETKSAEDLKQ